MSCSLSKAKIGALNSLKAGDFLDLFQMLGDEDATYSDLMETGQSLHSRVSSVTRNHD